MISPLVGRTAELAALRALLARDGVQVITLTGPGGVGKTRLALELARSARGRFGDGVFFANLAAVTDPAAVGQVLGHALGFQQGSAPLESRLLDFVRGREALVVLDNFENVLPAAALVQRLAAEAPRLKLLVTSRAPLKLEVETEVALLPLGPPDAVRLLAQHAPGLGAAHATPLAEICQRLDGLPLALELAGRQLLSSTPAELLARLDAAPLLDDDGEVRKGRHRTLRDTIAWSFRLLTPPEQQGFAALAVFPSDASPAAAAHVTGDAHVVDALVRHHLVELQGDRVRLLQTVRAYAAEVLAKTGAGAEAAARARHAGYFARLVGDAGARIEADVTPADLDLIERELDHVRAALDWYQRQGAWDDGLKLGVAVSRFIDMRGYWQEGLGWLTLFADRASNRRLKARALNRAGVIVFRQGDFRAAGALHQQSLALCEELGDEAGSLDAIDRLQWVVMYQGKITEGAQLAERGWAVAQRLGDVRSLARALGQRGWIEFEQGHRKASEQTYAEAVKQLEAQPDRADLAYMLNALGEVQRSRGDFRGARVSYERCLDLARTIGIKRQMAPCTFNLAMVARSLGERETEIAYLLESLRLTLEIGSLQNLPLDLMALAHLCAMSGQAPVGARILGAAEAMLTARGGEVVFADKEDHTAASGLLRAHLGAGVFDALRAEGARLSADAAIALAMAALGLEAPGHARVSAHTGRP